MAAGVEAVGCSKKGRGMELYRRGSGEAGGLPLPTRNPRQPGVLRTPMVSSTPMAASHLVAKEALTGDALEGGRVAPGGGGRGVGFTGAAEIGSTRAVRNHPEDARSAGEDFEGFQPRRQLALWVAPKEFVRNHR